MDKRAAANTRDAEIQPARECASQSKPIASGLRAACSATFSASASQCSESSRTELVSKRSDMVVTLCELGFDRASSFLPLELLTVEHSAKHPTRAEDVLPHRGFADPVHRCYLLDREISNGDQLETCPLHW